MRRLRKCTGSAAAALLAMQAAGVAQAQTAACPAGVRVPENDPAVDSTMVTLHGEGGSLFAYLSRPAGQTDPRPGVIVVHENRGLNEHIKDVNRRMAKAGFVALAIDLLSRQGGTDRFPDPERAFEAYNRTVPAERRQDLISALLTLRAQPYVLGGQVGVLGFCAGGGNAFDLAVNTDQLDAVVVFYGSPPTQINEIASMTAPLLGVFGELDRGISGRLPDLLRTVQSANKRYALHVYEGTSHAFHNDTGSNYNQGAACDAWAKTIDFLSRQLNPPPA